MPVLCMKFAAPMQSWGGSDTFDDRSTEREPTKSGVLGVMCAALGLKRWDIPVELTDLRLGVRVDREGLPLIDFQTVGGGNLPDGNPYGVYVSSEENLTKANAEKRKLIRRKAYLCDAAFLVCLEDCQPGGANRLHGLLEVLRRPRWPLYLGRRCCPPSCEIGLSVMDNSELEDALRDHPWLDEHSDRERPSDLRVIREVVSASADRRFDQPISGVKRGFGFRFVTEYYVSVPEVTP